MYISQANRAITEPVNDDTVVEKKAKLIAIDFLHETFIAFKDDTQMDCDNGTKKNIKQIHYFMSELNGFGRSIVCKQKKSLDIC